MPGIEQNSITKRTRYIPGGLLILLGFLLGACVPPTIDPSGDFQATPPALEAITPKNQADTSSTPSQEIRSREEMPEQVPFVIGTPIPAVTGETPIELLRAIQADLADQSGVDLSEIRVVRDQMVIWSDGSLGCPQPEMMYTQALVPGYWVVLQVGDKEYDYRAAESGYFFRCENGGLHIIQSQDQ